MNVALLLKGTRQIENRLLGVHQCNGGIEHTV
jgi:hypothetical protein